jgi:hypothetical protein
VEELFGSGYGHGRGFIESSHSRKIAIDAYDALWQAINALIREAVIKGIAGGLMLAGREDLIASHPDLEKAAAVIMAERMNRKDSNDS